MADGLRGWGGRGGEGRAVASGEGWISALGAIGQVDILG